MLSASQDYEVVVQFWLGRQICMNWALEQLEIMQTLGEFNLQAVNNRQEMLTVHTK